MRIDKYMSMTGVYSRRETGRLIAAGRITINHTVCEKDAEVEPGDLVAVDGEPVSLSTESPVYLALNKPLGITCTAARSVEGNIIDFVNYPSRIFPVGRLDKNSEGLILLTNDGGIVNTMMRSENGHEKEYRVTIDKPVTPEFLNHMSMGVAILNTVTKPCKTYALPDSELEFGIILTQGLNLQIRRMCKELGCRVLRLERVRIMNIGLNSLQRGEWRHLTSRELEELLAALDK
ncbi:23S rRNA pseudouridine synthase F [Paenibacillus sp. PK3_47]|uniref:pseudouridine synthase n=1 Tax=Paenibacillus sp. PK3_47 TaxID=2072642 RepID=UPI00201E6EF6|nr:pseudouridine synthase [Paenibacillus sp. PK3_47]UQZ36406.1 23S rRNA pseudouridine synthase F [Paenibacillus sp. PK3_47]